jgi:hypothetical protein
MDILLILLGQGLIAFYSHFIARRPHMLQRNAMQSNTNDERSRPGSSKGAFLAAFAAQMRLE